MFLKTYGDPGNRIDPGYPGSFRNFYSFQKKTLQDLEIWVHLKKNLA